VIEYTSIVEENGWKNMHPRKEEERDKEKFDQGKWMWKGFSHNI
jgi:hypothetical protein